MVSAIRNIEFITDPLQQFHPSLTLPDLLKALLINVAEQKAFFFQMRPAPPHITAGIDMGPEGQRQALCVVSLFLVPLLHGSGAINHIEMLGIESLQLFVQLFILIIMNFELMHIAGMMRIWFDHQVIEWIQQQALANQELVSEQIMSMLKQDDLFTKAMIDSSLKNMDQLMEQGLPEDARMMLGMIGFKIVINVHGELVNLDMPSQELPGDEEW